MKSSFKLNLSIFLVVMVAGFVWWNLKHTDPVLSTPTNKQNTFDKRTPQSQSAEREEAVSYPPNETTTPPSDQPLNPELEKTIQAEAALLDHSQTNPEIVERRIRKIISDLSKDDQKQLVKKATGQAPINQRVLASYLLIEAGAKAIPDLKNLISEPLNRPGPYPVHSLEETLSMQERSIRIMAIDGLAAQAVTSAEARKALGEVARNAQHETIRNYAGRKLVELK